jgi:outer membrane protein assembly factor BamB
MLPRTFFWRIALVPFSCERVKSVVILLLGIAALASHAENWPSFRGPTRQGISAEKNVPLHWGADSNVVWKTEVPGVAWSSPIVWEDRVFVTTATENGTSCRIVSIDAKSGNVLWNTEVFKQVPRRKEGKNSYATPTPATDGKKVYAVFGEGGVAAVDFKGSVLWTNREVQFYSRHGLGASPILHKGLLIMPYDGSNPVGAAGSWPNNSDEERLGWQIPWDRALIVALDTKTGKRAWTGKRGKSRIAHVSPILVRRNLRTQLISPAGDAIQGFNPKTGELIWTVYSQGEGVTPSPVVGDGVVFTSSGFEKPTLRAVKLGGKGDVTATHIAWEQRKGTPTQPSLLYVKSHLYALTDGGIAHCYNAKNGDIVWEERIGGNHSASPIYADGRIYFLSEAGETKVIKAGEKFEELARNTIGEKCQASMAVSGGRIFIRSEKNLYCIGERN